jgi:hypothetical protein
VQKNFAITLEVKMNHSIKNVSSFLFILFCAVPILVFSVVFLFSAQHQPSVLAESAYLFHPGIGEAVIDGSIGVDEWNDADTHVMLLASANPTLLYGTLYVMQSSTDLYLAFNVNDDELTMGYIYGLYGDTLIFDFDDDNSGSLYEVNENQVTIFAADPGYADNYYYEATGASEPDTNITGGTTDGQGDVDRHEFYNQYELRFPLCSGDTKDFCLYPGDILGLRIQYCDVFPIEEGFDLDVYSYPNNLNTSLVTIEIADVNTYTYLPLIMK